MEYPPSMLRRVKKPIRYVGGEFNSVRKDPDLVRSLVALVFPDVYEIGMSHLGSRLLYQVLNSRPEVAAERVFCPWPDMERQLREHGLPLLSLENGLPLDQFHIVAFSLLYEMTFTNVLTVLSLGKIPWRTVERQPHHPLVIGGGPAVSNPEPMADFFDLLHVGEGEDAILEIQHLERKSRKQRLAGTFRAEYLRRFADIEGVYIPVLYPTRRQGRFFLVEAPAEGKKKLPFPIRRRWVQDLDDHLLPQHPVVPSTDIVHDRVTIEISRGCAQGCRFCHASFFYRPQRQRSPDSLIRGMVAMVDQTGYEEVTLASLSSGSYPGVETLTEIAAAHLYPRRTALSLPSLRASQLSARLADTIAGLRKTGFTVAPEAGTQRLRDVINKGLTEDEIIAGVLAAYRAGWNLIKLYFMIGLPTETVDDVTGITHLVGKILAAVRREPDYPDRRRKFAVNLSVSPFVPKPHTPFQWAPMDSDWEIQRKVRLLKGLLRDRAVTLRWHEPALSRLEGVFARGDRSLGRVIEEAWQRGARFDGWDEHFRPEVWSAAFAASRVNPADFLETRSPTEPLPWSHVDLGISLQFLQAEWTAAQEGRVTSPCSFDTNPAAKGRERRCAGCGIGCKLALLSDHHTHHLQQLEVLRRGIPAAGAVSQPKWQAFRAEFTKLGPAVWLSHLDLIRNVQRIIRRAGLPLKYTEGFHPHPQLGFSPALSVGVGSRGEYVDGFLADETQPLAEWLPDLNCAAIDGIRFLSLEALPIGAPSIEGFFRQASYALRLPAGEVDHWLADVASGGVNAAEWLRRTITGLLERETIGVVRHKEGKPDREKDLRPFILDAGVQSGPEGVELTLQAALTPQGTIRVEEWLALCLPGYDGPYEAIRSALLSEEASHQRPSTEKPTQSKTPKAPQPIHNVSGPKPL